MSSRKKSSYIWEQFTIIDEFNAKCNLCKNLFSYKSTLTNLKKHIQSKHTKLPIPTKTKNNAVSNEAIKEVENHEEIIEIAEVNFIDVKEFSMMSPDASIDENNLKKSSIIWNYFTKVNKFQAKCNICQNILSFKTSVTNLKRHLQRKHSTIEINIPNTTNIFESNETTNSIIESYEDEESTENEMNEVKLLVEEFSSMDNTVRNPKRTSLIWNHFTDIGNVHAKCNLCKKILSYKSSLTNLKRHIQSKHPGVEMNLSSLANDEEIGVFETDEEMNENFTVVEVADTSFISAANIITDNGKDEYASNKNLSDKNKHRKRKYSMVQDDSIEIAEKNLSTTREKIDNELMNLFILGFQPFSLVSDKSFKSFVEALNPSYVLPNQEKISEIELPALYDKALCEAKELSKTIEKCSITIDGWTSYDGERFLAITAHFIDKNFERITLLLGCINFNENDISHKLASKLKEFIDEWKITEKCILAVSSNANDIEAVIKLTFEDRYVSCFAYNINFIVLNSLEALSSVLEKIRNIASHLKKSSKANIEIFNYQRNKNVHESKKIILDVAEKWNSTFYMLERFCELQHAIKAAMEILDENLPILNIDEWIIIEQATKILRPFESITNLVSGENYIPASMVIILVNGLKDIIKKINLQIDDGESHQCLRLLISKLNEGIKNRLDYIEESNTICMATFFDPRFKNFAFSTALIKETIKANVINATSILIKNTEIENDIEIETERPVIDENCIWNFYENIKPKKETANLRAINEVERYLEEVILPRNKDPLLWWKEHHSKFPNLKVLAKEYLPAMITSAPCERFFSTAAQLFHEKRKTLQSDYVEKIVFLNQNLNHVQLN